MNFSERLWEKVWPIVKRKAVEVIVAALTAVITALTTTSPSPLQTSPRRGGFFCGSSISPSTGGGRGRPLAVFYAGVTRDGVTFLTKMTDNNNI